MPEVSSTAHSCFYNTLGVVSGPFHLGLERQLERARKWREDLTGTPGEQWRASSPATSSGRSKTSDGGTQRNTSGSDDMPVGSVGALHKPWPQVRWGYTGQSRLDTQSGVRRRA
jgi:hypothetical protein